MRAETESGGEEGQGDVVEWSDGGRRLPGEAAHAVESAGPAELQYRLFVERVRDYAIFLLDADGRVTHWGEGAVRVKEFTPEEAVGMHLSRLYPPGGAEDGTAEEHLRYAAEHGEYLGEGMRVARDRGLFPARVCLTSLWRDGRLFGFSKVTQDLSERKRVEERLEHALRAAEAANVEKSRFLATMSHEIRTPINAILGYAELLDMDIRGPLAPEQRAYLERIRASGQHLLELVQDVLDFSRVEAGRLPVEPRRLPLAEVVEQALGLLRPQAAARDLELAFECEAPVECWGDEMRVRQILVNLVGNAIKFTEPGGRIQVVAGPREPGEEASLPGAGPWCAVTVRDTGIGIPADHLSVIFEPFIQVEDSLTRVHQGTGLGLAISRRLARLLGGDLSVRSRPGAGSVFTLWLPSTDAAAVVEEPAHAPHASLTPVGHYLSGAAHRVVRAAIERLRAEPGVPEARERTRSELEDHLGTMLADMAQVLVILEEDGADTAGTVQDAHDVQVLLAERHGRQRRRIGWTRAALEREYEILREEVEATLREGSANAPGRPVDEGVEVVSRLLERARHASLRAFGAD